MKGSDVSWYVLNYVASPLRRKVRLRQAIERFNTSCGTTLDLFAPTFVEMAREGGHVVMREKPLVFHYVFVRGTLDEVKQLCRTVEGFSFVLNHCGEARYVTVSNSSMHSFMTIARFYGNQLPCYQADDVDFQDGDLVEIVSGSFAGLQGRYVGRKGSSRGNILIAVTRSLAAMVCDVSADYVRVLEFAHDSKRPYDQIEAFIPRLLRALRTYSAGEPVDTRTLTAVSVFCRRFSAVRLDNPKLEAKLMLMLVAGNTILGREADLSAARMRYERLIPAITNPWTQSLASLVFSVLRNDSRNLRNGLDLIAREEGKESRFQKMLREEYRYYMEKAQAAPTVDNICV